MDGGIMYLGLDLGTSGVKAILTGDDGAVLAQATAPLTATTPHPRWSEQNPADWWKATVAAIGSLRAQKNLATVRAIGVAGQMHGAVLLDAAGHVLRPAILWNDGRSERECAALEKAEPRSREITGNSAMPGFTAPKLLWLRANEPDIFAKTNLVLLPKDWLRKHLTGEAVSEMSDASGTLWLDTGARRWSEAMLAASGLPLSAMPRLVEGIAPAGRLRSDIAGLLGLPPNIPVAAGAGDNAAGAIGIGCISPGDAFVSLGTSGVIFVADETFLPDPARTVHAFCHAVPDMWHRMSVILSAGGALAWLARLFATPEAILLQEAEAASPDHDVVFLPYLSGERTPHNDPAASGVLFGLRAGTDRASVTRAVLEGVAFALADGLEALEASGGAIPDLTAIGGGARSRLWLRILAASLGRRLHTVEGSEIGPALGAARLASIACGAATLAEACTRPRAVALFEPDPALSDILAGRRALHRQLYPALRPSFTRTAGARNKD